MTNSFTLLYESPIGVLRIVGNEDYIECLDFKDAKEDSGEPPYMVKLCKEQLDQYFNGTLKNFTLRLKPHGTDFQKEVWDVLRTIPWGEKMTYSDIARLLGDKKKARAAGNAIGANPIIIVIPCHRVIHADGTLGGFSCGIEKKVYLLSHEAKLRQL